jgi:hypothetical protein
MLLARTSHSWPGGIWNLPAAFQLHWTKSSVRCRSATRTAPRVSAVPRSVWAPSNCGRPDAGRPCHHPQRRARDFPRALGAKRSWEGSEQWRGARNQEMDILRSSDSARTLLRAEYPS